LDALVFSAHPDDVEMAMGGTILKMIRAGKKVRIVDLTRGERGTFGSGESREKEARAAARVHGAEVELLDFPDTNVQETYEGKKRIAAIIRTHRPSIAFGPYYDIPGSHHDGRANPDHQATGRLVRDGVKLARLRKVDVPGEPHQVHRVLYYMVPQFVRPHFVVDVTDVRDDLFRAIEAYTTQMEIRRKDNSILDLLEVSKRATGALIGKRYGEAFLCEDVFEFGVGEIFRV
jgi:bacillithiol biosynthesis deacetylase BshB1